MLGTYGDEPECFSNHDFNQNASFKLHGGTPDTSDDALATTSDVQHRYRYLEPRKCTVNPLS